MAIWRKRLLTLRPAASISPLPSIPAPRRCPFSFPLQPDKVSPPQVLPRPKDFLLTVSAPQFPARGVPDRCAVLWRLSLMVLGSIGCQDGTSRPALC